MVFLYILIGAFVFLLIGRMMENSKEQRERKEEVQTNSFRDVQRQPSTPRPMPSYDQVAQREEEY